MPCPNLITSSCGTMFAGVCAVLLCSLAIAQTPPMAPRGINDITALLDQYRPDPKALDDARKTIAQQPPATEDRKQSAEFFLTRARAYEKLGKTTERISDLRQAREFVREGATREDEILAELAVAEINGGNYANAIATTEERIRLHGYLYGYTEAALFNAMAGDLSRAKTYLAQADNLLSTMMMSKYNQYSHDWVATVERARGAILQGEGKYAEAEIVFRRVIQEREQFIVPNDVAWKHSYPLRQTRDKTWLASNLLQQGRLLEAETVVRAALQSFLQLLGRNAPDTASAVGLFSRIVFEQGRYQEARVLAKAAIESLELTGASPETRYLAAARDTLGSILVSQGKWSEALDVFERMRKALEADPFSLERFGSGGRDWAVALIQSGRHAEAILMLQPIIARTADRLGAEHYQTAELRGVLGMALWRSRNRQGALDAFRQAVKNLLATGRPDAAEQAGSVVRAERLQLILQSYIALLWEMRESGSGGDTDASAEAFRLADAARGQKVQRAVYDSAARFAVNDPDLATLARKEQDLRNEIAALYNFLLNMLSAPPEQQLPRVTADMRKRIEEATKERGTVFGSIEKRFPNYANLINPKPISVEDARRALRPGEVLLSILVTPERTFVWAVSKDGPLALAAVSLGEADLAKTVGRLRHALDPGDVSPETLPAFDVATASALYEQLLKPVESGWKGARTLLVVANGALGQLPLAVLPTTPTAARGGSGELFAEYRAVPWLVKTVAIVQLPSVNALVTLRSLPASGADRLAFVGFGDPRFGSSGAARALQTRGAGLSLRAVDLARVGEHEEAVNKTADWVSYSQLAPLPDTRDEILAIAAALKADPAHDVFFGADASKKKLKTLNLSKRRVVAFATHGLIPGDFPGLAQPALALAAPDDPKESGLLTLEEILGLKLDADWVVLSACNTAAGDGAGAEAVSGLGRAFFYAGARALLVTNWPVETTSARALTTTVFQRQAADASLSRAEALRASMLSLLDGPGYVDPATGKVVFSYAHPIFWAPFSLVGDGR